MLTLGIDSGSTTTKGVLFDGEKVVKSLIIPTSAPPRVSIYVDGEAVEMPANPVRSTNANGYVGYDRYEVTYSVPAEQTKAPKVTAKADNKNVKIEIVQPQDKTGEAVVTCDYNGVVKTYTVKLTE